jgi:hypothetical protein
MDGAHPIGEGAATIDLDVGRDGRTKAKPDYGGVLGRRRPNSPIQTAWRRRSGKRIEDAMAGIDERKVFECLRNVAQLARVAGL